MGERLDATWIWNWLMDYCKKQNISPASQSLLFQIVSDARKIEEQYGNIQR